MLDIIQIFSQIATATGVCFAAYYYITTLRNAEKTKRKERITQRLPNFSLEYYNTFVYTMYKMNDWNTLEELQ
ncbi:hypothetical protein FJY84_05820 [Candidatus Bathyarchaeota archaeon]|nr:hypothetical protein [Candidatus Bathyarchaeota archaeon]